MLWKGSKHGLLSLCHVKYKSDSTVDFLETFLSVLKLLQLIFFFFLTLATTYNWPLAHMDVNSVFLNDDLF